MTLPQQRHKAAPCRKNRGSSHQHHHHLTAGKAGAHQQMPQQSGFTVLIIRQQLALLHDGSHRARNLVRLAVLNQAALHRYHPMAVFLINARDDLSAPVHAKADMAFVAVAPRLYHPNDLIELGSFVDVAFHQLLHRLLLPLQLAVILQVLHLAAAALGKSRTLRLDTFGRSLFDLQQPCVQIALSKHLDDRLLAGQQSVHRQLFSFQIHHAAALFVHSVAADRIFSRFDCRFVPILPLLLRLWFSLLLRL